MWNGLNNGHVAETHRKPDGLFHCDLNAHVALEYNYPNIRDAVKGLMLPIDKTFRKPKSKHVPAPACPARAKNPAA